MNFNKSVLNPTMLTAQSLNITLKETSSDGGAIWRQTGHPTQTAPVRMLRKAPIVTDYGNAP